jgi:carbonic anhydrase
MSDRYGNNQVVVTDFTGDPFTYQTRNFRFRSPSEHTIDGVHLAAELQVFFTDETNGTHVLSYLIDTAEDDSDDLTVFLASDVEY